SARDAARQRSLARDRPAARAVVGHGKPAADDAGAAQDGASRGSTRGEAGRERGVMAEPIAFWTLAAILVGSALAVVLSRNLFHAVLWLAFALTGTAGIF